MIEAAERVDFNAGEEFAVTLDGWSKRAGGEFWNAEIVRSHDIQDESGGERGKVDVFKMLHVVSETGHHGGGREQESGDAGPVAGVAIAVVDEIAEDRSEEREKNGADEDGGNPESGDREKCGVND